MCVCIYICIYIYMYIYIYTVWNVHHFRHTSNLTVSLLQNGYFSGLRADHSIE